MPNCYFDIALAYIDSDWKLTQIVQMRRPFNLDLGDKDNNPDKRPLNTRISLEKEADRHYQSRESVQFALEMEKGWFAAHNLSRDVKIKPSAAILKFLELAE